MRTPLEILSRNSTVGVEGRVVVVFDNVQEVLRLGGAAIELIARLPEVLQQGDQLTVLTIGRLPLSHLGLSVARDPPTVAFPSYSEQESEALLQRELGSKAVGVLSPAELYTLVNVGLLKFAVPFVGRDIHTLLSIGVEILRSPPTEAERSGNAGNNLATLQRRIENSVQRRLGLCDLRGLQAPSEAQNVGNVATTATMRRMANVEMATTAAMRRMTNAEKRLIVAAYVAGYVDKEDDVQLFMPKAQKGRKRRSGVVKRRKGADDGRPCWTRAPRPVPLSRFLAIYHHLAQQPQLLSPSFFEHLAGLREARLMHLLGDRRAGTDSQEPRVLCCAELPLARACATELNVKLAEYLLQH